MDSKYTPEQRRPAAASILDQRKLTEFRKRSGLSLMAVAKLTGIAKSTICGYEHGESLPPLHRLLVLCRIYELDPFEIVELLRLPLFEVKLLKAFRRACKAENTSPQQALQDFLKAYSYT